MLDELKKKPDLKWEINVSTLLMVIGMLAAIFLDHQNTAVLLDNYGTRLKMLEDNRITDRQDEQSARTDVTRRLDDILKTVTAVQINIAAITGPPKADRR